MLLQQNINLSDLTTIKLGGRAQYFVAVKNKEELQEALAYAKEHTLRVYVLGGGSNVVFADDDLAYMVIKIDMRGITYTEVGGRVIARVGAGEEWNTFVLETVEKNLAGIECLAGIPGSVGATPMQNVGAYGQEVSETIERVFAIHAQTGEEIVFTNKECAFAYRTSRFKTYDKGKYITTAVDFKLTKNGAPTLKYEELAKIAGNNPTLAQTREAVLTLRKSKSMLLDPNDPNSVSCGSFFTNPIVSLDTYKKSQSLWEEHNISESIPFFEEPNGNVKIPAGWLIERAGWKKGYTKDGVGISDHHALALVNRGGTTKALLLLAQEIQQSVKKTFAIELAFEPNVVE